MSYPNKRTRVERILATIPAGTQFTSKDISDLSTGCKGLTVSEVSGILPGCKNVQNITHRGYGIDTYIKLEVTE